MNHYPHHIGDFNNATRHLSRVERSIYRDLLDLYYDSERPLPSDIPALARRILATDERAALEAVLGEFFVLETDGFHNERCDRELAAYQAMAEGGRRGAAKRWGKGLDSHPIATPSKGQCQPEPEPEPIKEREPRATRLASGWVLPQDWKAWALKERPDLDPDLTAAKFADFWHSKPGKDGRKLDWLATWRNWVREERAPKLNPADVARQTVYIPPKPSAWLAEQDAHRAAVEAERIARKARQTA
jgi:uncharacterized protein YdaU (DUF1376 family)